MRTMSDTPVKCALCDAAPSFGPYGTVRACEPCARRVARLAGRSNREARSTIWATADAPATVAKPVEPTHPADADPERVFEQFKRGVEQQLSAVDGESHLHLAIAYREMGLYGDAVREAAVAFEAAPDRKVAEEALGLLLTPTLLRPDGIDAMRARLRMN